MVKKLAKAGNSLALVIDKPLFGVDADTPLEFSTDRDVLAVTPKRVHVWTAKPKAVLREAHERFGGAFRRLAD